jgi:hypothetical protein
MDLTKENQMILIIVSKKIMPTILRKVCVDFVF